MASLAAPRALSLSTSGRSSQTLWSHKTFHRSNRRRTGGAFHHHRAGASQRNFSSPLATTPSASEPKPVSVGEHGPVRRREAGAVNLGLQHHDLMARISVSRLSADTKIRPRRAISSRNRCQRTEATVRDATGRQC